MVPDYSITKLLKNLLKKLKKVLSIRKGAQLKKFNVNPPLDVIEW